MRESLAPPLHISMGLDDLAPDHPFNEEKGRIVRALGGGSIFVLLGPRGVGKTQMSTLAIRHLAETTTSRYFTALGLVDAINARFDWKKGEFMDRLASVGLLVIDEWQLKPTKNADDSLRIIDLIDRRYRARKDTMILANITLAAMPAAVGDSIASRISERGEIVVFSWPSFREPTP